MNNLILFIALVLLTSGRLISPCSVKAGKITGYHLEHHSPVPDGRGGFLNGDTYYDVFYMNDLRLYKLNYFFDSTVSKRVLLEEHRPYFFVFHKDSSFGIVYYTNLWHGEKVKRVNKDSLLKINQFESSAYDTFSKMKPDSSYIKDGDLVKEYQIFPTEEFPEKYTYSFYYSKSMNPPTECFSKLMDNIKGMRLYKIHTFAHGGYWPSRNVTYPPRELNLEMSLVSEKDKEEAREYFNRYKEKRK